MLVLHYQHAAVIEKKYSSEKNKGLNAVSEWKRMLDKWF